jgi:cation transport ATPase
MKHQPYESWILDEVPLNEQQKQELEAHLKTCSPCSSLQSSWQEARKQIQSTTVRQPSAGFAMRWQTGLEERRIAEEHRQRQNVWIWIACVSAAVVLALAVIFLPRISFVQILIDMVESLVGLTTAVTVFLRLVTSVFRSISPLTLVLAYLGLSTLLILTVFLWGISIWRMSLKGVAHYEKD